MMNNPHVQEYAKGLANRVSGKPMPEAIREAYQLALGRDPAPDELGDSVEFAAQAGLPRFCQALLSLTEFLYVD